VPLRADAILCQGSPLHQPNGDEAYCPIAARL